MIYPSNGMTTELKQCKGCHHSWPLCYFDIKKTGTVKLTCRKCLLSSKSRFQARAAIAAYRDTKKIRMDIMTAIHMIEDQNILTTILAMTTKAVTHLQIQNLNQSSQSLAALSLPRACISGGTEHTMAEGSIVLHDIAASSPQILDLPA